MEMKGKITIYDDNGDTIIKISETKNDFTDIIQKMLENIFRQNHRGIYVDYICLGTVEKLPESNRWGNVPDN